MSSIQYDEDYYVNMVRPQRSLLPQHHDYYYYFRDWLTMWDTAKGEREVKLQNTLYLPKTAGMDADATNGWSHYDAYKTRAIYFDYVSETIMSMFGLFWQKDPAIECSDFIKEWMKEASIEGNTFMEVYRDLVYNIIWKGRYGILIDIPSPIPGEDTPQIVTYTAESIVNWGWTKYKGKRIINFILLDESSMDVDPATLNYEVISKWRLLGLKTIDDNGNELPKPIYFTVSNSGNANNVNFVEYMNTGMYNMDDEVYPSFRGKKLNYIPFIFANVTNTKPEIQKPPLLNLANICLGIYRGDADYREALFKQAQATLFGKGFENASDVLLGASSIVSAPDKDADLKFVEISGAGLSSMRDAEKDLIDRARQIGVSLTQKSSGDETGASVQKHITMQTSVLKAISTTAGDVMSQVIKIIMEWTGNVSEFTLVPSQDFSTASESADGFLKMWSSFKEGALTPNDFYEWQKYNEYTTKPTFDEWWKELKEWFNFVNVMDIEKQKAIQDIKSDSKDNSNDEEIEQNKEQNVNNNEI